jgi:hypothetical protein
MRQQEHREGSASAYKTEHPVCPSFWMARLAGPRRICGSQRPLSRLWFRESLQVGRILDCTGSPGFLGARNRCRASHRIPHMNSLSTEQVVPHQPAIIVSFSFQHPFTRAGGRTHRSEENEDMSQLLKIFIATLLFLLCNSCSTGVTPEVSKSVDSAVWMSKKFRDNPENEGGGMRISLMSHLNL